MIHSFLCDDLSYSQYTNNLTIQQCPFARIDRSKFRELDGKLIVPATMSLNTKAAFRMFSFHIEEHTWLAMDPVPLPPTPTAANFEWSELLPLREARTTNSQYVYTDVKLRLRIVKGEVFKPK